MSTIAQISDIHIGADYGRFDTHGNFEKVLDDIRIRKDINHIVITGDLADDNYLENYKWVKQKLDDLGIFYIILDGNHDDKNTLKQVFGDNYYGGGNCRGGDGEYSPYLYLDTSSSYITEEQLELISCGDVVFTHFPILPVRHNFMNKGHSLALNIGMCNYSGNKIKEYLESRNLYDVYIFCGHYHFDNYTQAGNYGFIKQFVCPSTQAQLDSNSKELKISCLNPAYRLIHLEGNLETEVVYLQ